MKILSDESGQSLVLAVLCMACLLGFVGLATDVGTMFHAKRNLQIAADAAAIAGAAEINFGDVTTAAQTDAAQNGVTNGSGGATVTVNGPPGGPLYGPHAGNGNYVEVIVSQTQPTFFMKLFNRSSMTVTARAVATLGSSSGCVYTLSPTGASNPNLPGADFYFDGSAILSVPTCGIVDDSDSGKALALDGSVIINAKSIGVVGGYSRSGSEIVNPTPVTGLAPTSDPLAFLTEPIVSSTCPVGIYTGAATLNPGCFSGLSLTGSSVITLNPGLYVINGSLTIGGSATVTGTGVTFYITNGGAVNLSGSEIVNISAPTSGTYNGVLFFQDRTDTSPFTYTGSAIMNLQGIFYFPSASVTFNGSVAGTLYADFVADTFSDIGSAVWQDYATINGNSVLTSPLLVE